jgi:prepilin-type N-terminal cleavage/methylation domain-containing protein
MTAAHTRRSAAFSLIELVIVVVIIGIIAAIAIPRMSRGAEGAGDSALTADLTTLRNAIDLFQTEHGGAYPDLVTSPNFLTQYTNEAGTAFQATKDATYFYGPYIRAIPKLPVGVEKGKNTFTAGPAYTAGFGWIYIQGTGTVTANTKATEADARGVLYSSY